MKNLRLLTLFCCSLFLASECQNDNGAAYMFQKTSFSCTGRPAGYYADVETGCQIYHMCDGLGRQFSYTCPNTTLFQQRMLICDHWYMVNCSKAESDYAANLLIGQRDKPFVNDEENSLRTPRPDLLDRPYAPDYSGESFRNQYKQLTAVQNQIHDESNKMAQKPALQQIISGQTHWRIPAPSRTILPPAYEPQIELSSTTTPRTTKRTTASTTTEAPIIRQTSTRKIQRFVSITKPTKRTIFNEALHPRKPQVFANTIDADDLGTSHSTRYNTSADFNSAELTTKTQKANKTSEDEERQTPTLLRTSTAAPFSTAAMQTPKVTTTTTTARPISRPTTYAGLPFTTSPTTSTTVTRTSQSIRTPTPTPKTELRTPAPAQSFRLATPTVSSNTQHRQIAPQLPYADLLPPFVDFVAHDIATTQGPPIYYEWKVPSNGLEPPKFDAPIGVDGREYPETNNDYTAKSTQNSIFNTKLNDIASDPASLKSLMPETRTPISRSVKAEATVQSVTEKAQRRADVLSSISSSNSRGAGADITQLRKELLIPEYAFPLENIGRTGYGSGDIYNSFQLKIPEQVRSSNSAPSKRHWFGENPKCPECHPSFVIPGTCEPCLQR
ncbi:mucin-5AC isoform X2 [Scaptodrosophila lebanonensis]|uniref:Mucin-5AC isoform X2 n=1 Tax=Drosophila lebanonensis TaxID=7225 RepID=A0A6J2TG31_DROLE|nr:mucin-5AC isoform X2 [Scaptodrosophila lebanonensis]